MTNETSQLGAMLNNDEPAEEVEPAVAEPETPPEETETPSRDERGRFAAKGDTPSELPKEEYKAVREEREKRQALERELEALRQQKEPPAPPPSVWEDEQGYTGHVVSQAGQAGGFQGKLWASEFDAMRAHPDDFPEMKERFIKLAEENPALANRALTAPHPWEEAYRIAKNTATMESLGAVDLADLEAKIEARLREEMGQSLVPQQPQQPLPPTLTGERNVGARSGPAWSGPPSLSEMLR